MIGQKITMFWVVYFHMASHTPTTIACCKRSDSGVQREVREREKNAEEERRTHESFM